MISTGTEFPRAYTPEFRDRNASWDVRPVIPAIRLYVLSITN